MFLSIFTLFGGVWFLMSDGSLFSLFLIAIGVSGILASAFEEFM